MQQWCYYERNLLSLWSQAQEVEVGDVPTLSARGLSQPRRDYYLLLSTERGQNVVIVISFGFFLPKYLKNAWIALWHILIWKSDFLPQNRKTITKFKV